MQLVLVLVVLGMRNSHAVSTSLVHSCRDESAKIAWQQVDSTR